jgi:hypothetical protein
MHWSELDPGSQSVLRWTLASALIWGAAFAATSVVGALISDVNPLDHLGPIGVFSVIGITVGGLVGPLARGLAERRRQP